jgi:hypothetical protein
MQVEPRNYASYLLRLRQIEQDGLLVWRATLESIQTGRRENFSDMQALVDFLADRFATEPIDSATPKNDQG